MASCDCGSCQSGFRYEEIADQLADEIRSGQLRGRLPSRLELANQRGVSVGTVQHALSLLKERGIVVTGSTRGTFTNTEQR